MRSHDANPFSDKILTNWWGSGVVQFLNLDEFQQPIITIASRVWGNADFRLSYFLRKILLRAETPMAVVGTRVVYSCVPIPAEEELCERLQPLPLICELHVFDPINGIVIRLTEAARSPDSIEKPPVPYGQVVLAPHAISRSKERELLIPRDDVERIGRMSKKYLKAEMPFFLAIARHRYIAAVNSYSRHIKTVIPYSEEYVEHARRKSSRVMEFV